MTEQDELDDAILGDDELPSDGYDLYKNYIEMQEWSDDFKEGFDAGYIEGASGYYTHRNGETYDPEVEGWYWIDTGYHRSGQPAFFPAEWRDGGWTDVDDGYEATKIELMEYRASYYKYGPIPMPERKE